MKTYGKKNPLLNAHKHVLNALTPRKGYVCLNIGKGHIKKLNHVYDGEHYGM